MISFDQTTYYNKNSVEVCVAIELLCLTRYIIVIFV